jgi:hypothetical protein
MQTGKPRIGREARPLSIEATIVFELNSASHNTAAIVNRMDLSVEGMLRPFYGCVVTSTTNAATGTPPPRIYLSGSPDHEP